MTLYATLDYTKSMIEASGTVDDAKLLRLIRQASRRIDAEFRARRPLFAPYKEARKVAITSALVNSAEGTLYIAPIGPLLELAAVSLGDTALAVGTQVETWPDGGYPPFTHLRLLGGSAYDWYDDGANTTGKPLLATITGFWGIHRDYANAFHAVDAVQDNPLTAAATTLTLTDVDGVDAYGLTPRLSAGDLVRIEEELVEVLATNTVTNTATVRRGANGTTAAAHAQATAVEVYEPEWIIRHAVARQAGMLYARLGAYSSTEVQGMGEVRYPSDLLGEVRAILNEFADGA